MSFCHLTNEVGMPGFWQRGRIEVHAVVTSAAVATALVWATASIASEAKPRSLPTMDFGCYTSDSLAFVVKSPGSEFEIGGDNYGKPVFRFTTISKSVLNIVEFPEFNSMRKEYSKSIFELSFSNSGSDYIFGWSDSEAMGLRIFTINQRDRLVSLLELPPGSQTAPFGTLRVLKCKDTKADAGPAPQSEDRSERTMGVSPIFNRALWRASKGKFPKRLPVRAQNSVSFRTSLRATVFKAPPLNHQAVR